MSSKTLNNASSLNNDLTGITLFSFWGVTMLAGQPTGNMPSSGAECNIRLLHTHSLQVPVIGLVVSWMV